MKVTKTPYAYVIEYRREINCIKIQWIKHFNRKIYINQKIANEAIDHMKKSGIYENWEFRILPIYL